jgi:hypothetical protein
VLLLLINYTLCVLFVTSKMGDGVYSKVTLEDCHLPL